MIVPVVRALFVNQRLAEQGHAFREGVAVSGLAKPLPVILRRRYRKG